MTSVTEHLARVLTLAKPLPPRRQGLSSCRGLVLAEALAARSAVPPFDNSAMDGFAVRREDLDQLPVCLRVLDEVPAGRASTLSPGPGECLRIMTGAPVPECCDQVVPVELTDQPAGDVPLPEQVTIQALPSRDHIRRRGEDAEVGDDVLPVGTLLDPAALAAAASTGHGELLVRPRPRVAVLATGAELVEPGRLPGPGQIPDSNSLMVAGLLDEAGAEIVWQGHVADRPEELADALAEALDLADLVVTTGGVSVGTHDVMHSVEGLHFDHLHQSPGGPQGWGLLQDATATPVPVLALPGNPVAAFVSVHLYAVPVLERLAGHAPGPRLAPGVAGQRFTSKPGRRSIVPVRLVDGRAVATSAGPGAGSHRIATLHRAEALAVIDEERTTVEPGDRLDLLPLG
ncbi:gephyrin-like molybdotransferase Glp [Luteococcus sp.]|uniref:molybdopterin molybdotransferase MoeA n=1 Tax=Luteococcus sp. TaxID=1969402 RepID=UPI0037358726